jgi:hypothetical protein
MRTSVLQRVSLGLLAIIAGAVALLMPRPAPAAGPVPSGTLPPYQAISPVRLLGFIRRVYRLHRPPPAFETYTLVRKQNTNYGYPDVVNSYTKHYWVRNIDRAALVRYVYRDDTDGPPTFDRPALNQPRDPGPPTADLFEPAHPQPISYVPTPEPTSNETLKTIGSVVAIGESDYNVPKLEVEGEMLHLTLQPRRDPERNVLREIWVDKHTYVLKRIIAHDRLFAEGDGVYPVKFTYTLGYLNGYVVITHLDGVVLPIVDKDKAGNITERAFDGDGATVTYDFDDITFPQALPDWYFNPREYGSHVADTPL